MKEISIEDLAYCMKEAKKLGKAPIFFLGAGASQTSGIPLAKKIISDVLKEHASNPQIITLKKEFHKLEEIPYFRVMSCLGPDKRKALFKYYIEKAMINVTHIYLAQLFEEGYVDYVVTVNFDNLMQRALALYNIFPPVYDLSNIKDRTTTTPDTESIIHLHGQYRGQWLLNTEEELDKINENVSPLFHSIMSGRPWIFIGYSANDPIWKVVTSLGSFDNGLYWVNYKNSPLNENVYNFLNKPNTNSFVINGYDADTFMLKLNVALEISQPKIFDQPFNVLKAMLESIVDIGDDEHYKGVKERLKESTERVKTIIASEKTNKVLQLSRKIRAFIMQDKYPEQETDEAARNKLIQTINELESDAKSLNNKDVSKQMVWIYNNWGNSLGEIAKTKSEGEAEDLWNKAIPLYEKVIKLDPKHGDSYYNCGIALGYLAEIKSGDDAEDLWNKAISLYEQSIKLDPKNGDSYYNCGIVLSYLAQIKNGEEAESLFRESILKYEKAIEVYPEDRGVYNNLGIVLCGLAQIKSGEEAESLFRESILKYEKAIEINPANGNVYNNWGIVLRELAQIKNGEEAEKLFRESILKYEKAIEVYPANGSVYNNYALVLSDLAKIKGGEEAKKLNEQVIEKYKQAIKYGGSSYDLACTYACMSNKKEALRYLGQSLLNEEYLIEDIKNDEDWKAYLEDADFIALLKKYESGNDKKQNDDTGSVS